VKKAFRHATAIKVSLELGKHLSLSVLFARTITTSNTTFPS
jgi:hypothetical protein